jgi:hypothetical protein
MEKNLSTSPAAQLAAALRERRSLIGDEVSRREQEQHLAKLQAISERIDTLAQRLPPPIDPQLAHFLARCSYDKALALLEG